MSTNFKGYYMKINGCTFENPYPSSFNYAPNLVQVTDAGTLASGKIQIKILPHSRKKISCSFPLMKPEQFRVYWRALRGDNPGEGMYLKVSVYDDSKDEYITDTFYHNDLTYDTVIANGERWIQINDFELIGH